jgi:hypothetical protein
MLVRPLLLVALLAQLTTAQAQDATQPARGATVSGVVHDSLARVPLAGATVQIAAADDPARLTRTAVSDSLGRFTLTDVPAGRYAIGFFHPMLDSLGVDAPLREVSVDGVRPVRADLAIPSPARLRAAICGLRSPLDSSAVLVGTVRDARDRAPVAGVTVTAEWLEFSFSSNGLVRRVPRLVATTGENGWFAMCNVPSTGMLVLIASRGADSTDRIEVQLSSDGFVRRDLYLGPARTVAAGDTTQRTEALAAPSGRLSVGDVRLSGTVIAAVGGRPLPGAHVGITAGPQTRTNERGEWTLVDAPAGTRMLEVRAVGYYPDRRPVNVVAGTPPVRVALSTLRAVLDTVKIVAARVRGRDIRGFLDRSRSGLGRYITEEDIARRKPIIASDLFRTVPGVAVDRTPLGDTMITMRGTFEDSCVPAFYIDGHFMRNLSADDINSFVNPKEIAGIEVYTGAGVPPQFQQGLGGCGSIVIWTK